MPFILKWETTFAKGHYGDYAYAVTETDKNDPGNWRDGKLVGTKFGIDAASHKGVDIAKLTLANATEIYWQEWTACKAESFEAGLGECFFDTAVNCGLGRAHKIMDDPAHPHGTAGFLDSRADFYRRLVVHNPKLAGFEEGWLNRITALRKFVNA